MFRIILPYFSLNTDVGFLRIKQQYVSNQFWLIAFFVHAFVAIICLFAGFTQFSGEFRRNHRNLHRKLGYVYAYVVLIFAAPSGFIIGLYANGKLISRMGFCILAMFWFYFTLKAVLFAQQKKFSLHQKFMIRSYALTLSAITLRIWKFVLANTLEINPLDLYQMVTWLGFVPNLLVAEYIINRLTKKSIS